MRSILSLHYTDIVIAVTLAVLVLCVVFAAFFFHKRGIEKKIQKILFKLFKTPSYRENFSFEEAKDWITTRSGMINGGYKAVLFNFTMNSKPCIDFIINGANFSERAVQKFFKRKKYIAVAIVDEAYAKDVQNYIKDSTLIEYSELDNTLLQILKKGNSILVVEGNEYK